MTQANNCIMLIGRAGRDPETRTVPSGRAVAKFTLAVDRPIKDKNGNKVTDWFDVSLWGKQAELAAQLIRKGSKISVVGSCNIDEWADNNGTKRKSVSINADGFQLLDSQQQSGSQQGGTATTQAAGSFYDDDFPPF